MQHGNAQSVGAGSTASRKWRFFGRRKAAIHGPQQEQTPPAPASWSISRSLKDVTLATFRRCLLEKDWKHIVTEGAPPQQVIEEAGESLFSEYLQMIGGADVMLMVEQSRQMQALASRLQRLALLISTARKIFSPALIRELAQDGFKSEAAKMEKADDTAYLHLLDKVESRLKSDELKLERLLKAEAPKQKAKTAQEIDNDIEQMIVAVEEMIGPGIDDSKISVYRFCSYVQRLRMKIEAQNRAISNGRGISK